MATRRQCRFAVRFAALLTTCGAFLVLSALAAAEGGMMGTIGRALSSFSGQSTGETFTISRIEPDVRSSQVRLHFTDRVEEGSLRTSMKFIPPVNVQWANVLSSTKGMTVVVQGGFKPGEQYSVVLPPNFRSAGGRTYVRTGAGFTMPDLDPEISFFEQGSLIERNSRQMLHVQLRNVNEVQFTGISIPPVLVWEASRTVQEGSARSWDDVRGRLLQSAARLNGLAETEAEFRSLAGLPREEQQLFSSREAKNITHQFSIPLSFRREREKGGIALVQLAGKNAAMPVRTPMKLYRITDLGVTYKLSDASIILWTTSLYSGRPVAGAALFAVTSAGDAVFLGRTGAKGFFRVVEGSELKHLPLGGDASARAAFKRIQIRNIASVIAVLPDDMTYLSIASSGAVPVENIEQVWGGSQARRSARRGHIFTERGIYRPGDEVHFKTTFREFRNGTIAAPASPATVRVRIRNSKNEEIYSRDLALSAFGTASDTIPVKQYYPLGTYTIQAEMPQAGDGKTEIAHRTFEVQEFRQPRHFVEIAYQRESRKDDSYVNLQMQKETLNCRISGKYYAGGPVKHGKARWSIYHTRSDYSRPDYPGYTFGHPLEARTDLIESGEAMLDEKGMLTVPVPLGADVLSGKYGIEVTASVVDFDGRASTESSVYQADPAYLVGISTHPPTVKPGEDQSLSAIVIDRKGNRVARGAVTVQVMERGYTYIQKRNAEGYLYHEQQQIWRPQLSAELALKDDRAVFDFDFTRGGDYLIAFTYRDADGREYVSATHYSMPGYYYDYGSQRQGQAKNYGKLTVYPEKPLYTPGETMKLFVNPPRGVSSFLLTVEQGGVVEVDTVELRPDQRSIELPVKESYNPNVYVSLLGTVPRSSFPVRAAEFDDEAPSFVFGTVNVEVKGQQQKIRIAVNEDQRKIKSLPGAQMTLNISATDQDGKGILSEMAVAVVDESILSMTGFETPSLDLLGKFLLPLGVFTGDLRLDLLRQTPYGFFRNMPLTGGDGEEAAGPEAVSSKIRKDFNPVAYFNPTVRTDVNGRATVTFTLPDTMTTYRVYAVACDTGSRFGSYQRPALVVKDFYMEPGLPAFLTRGDRFRFSVSSFNKTEEKGSVEFGVRSDDLLSLSAAGSAFRLDGFDRALIPVDGVAQRAGTTTMRFDGRFRNLADSIELKLPVNSGHVLGSDTVFGSFRGTARVSYALPQAVKTLRWEDVGPGEAQCTLTVSSSPFLRMAPGLRYFLRYPYG